MTYSIYANYKVALASIAACAILTGCAEAPDSAPGSWWKGNLHTHSFWSDGDQVPEIIVDWYASRDYDFLAISDHNTLQEGTRWKQLPERVDPTALVADYRQRFGADWVEHADSSGTHWIRLKTLQEYRGLFETPGEFLLVQSEEITDGFEGKPVHLNATNIQAMIAPQGGTSVFDVLQRNVDAVTAQREQTGEPIVPHVNHPNFGWGLTPADLVFLQGERLFEVYNGHPSVHNEGDSTHLSMEALWDVVLAERISRGSEVLYGIATDDAHNFHDDGPSRSNPGRGWVVVNAGALTPASLIASLESGRFYGSSGVALSRIAFDGETLTVEVEPGAAPSDATSYVIRFIGASRSYAEGDPASPEAGYDELDVWAASENSGVVFSEAAGSSASYTLTGDELYVRAVVVSDRLKSNPYMVGEFEKAWVQPVLPGSASFVLD